MVNGADSFTKIYSQDTIGVYRHFSQTFFIKKTTNQKKLKYVNATKHISAWKNKNKGAYMT